ncbi:MAG: VanZ family protein [Saprospiraceae bacterium]|nr:VanZ family protein [Saprospiraceae bacterium]
MLHHYIKKIFRIPWLPALMWAGLILWGSLVNEAPVLLPKQQFLGADKLVHALAYAGLGFLTLAGIKYHSKIKDSTLNTLLALGICLFFGIALEVVQGILVVERHFEYLDMLANAVGLGLGWIAYYLFIT